MYKLFSTSFIQVFLVAANVKFISTGHIYLMMFCAFFISIMWSFNVKKIAFGSALDKIVYALGATFGTICGYYFANYLITIL